MPSIPEAMAAALAHHRARQLPQAEQICRQILSVDPQHAQALDLLGVIALQVGEHQAAVDCLSRAVAIQPHVAKYHNDLAAAFHRLGQIDQALANCRRAVEIDPSFAEGHFNLALILREQGELEEAVASCQEALRIKPDYVEAHNNLGILWHDLGKLDEAVACYRRAIEVRPSFARAYNNLGVALVEQGRPDEAIASCERALQIDPYYAEAHFNQGNAFAAERKFDAAAACYQQALTIRPDHVAAHNKLASVLRDQGRFDEALAAHQQAIQLMPGNVEAHHSLAIIHEERGEIDQAAAAYREIRQILPHEPLWELRASTLCPNVFHSAEEIDEYRRRLLADLERFSQRDPWVDPAKLAILGTGPPYNLQFHGRDDRPIKEAYAEIFRHWRPGQAPRVASGRYRVGFVVTDPHEAIFIKCMRGVLENLNARVFEPVVICSPAGASVVRSAIRSESVGALAVPDRLYQATDAIRAGGFDLLYYWEVGSGTANYFLPFFRLARVQCTGWGLPVTSGIPQMDCFLSSELVEPDGAQAHYRERLVLASTLLTYQWRATLPASPKKREDFGIPADRHFYLCPQQIQKFHPDFDPILASILRRDELGVIVVPRDHHQSNTDRLASRFAATMPDVAGRIVFLPQQTYPNYLSLVAAADVLLDPIHFNGGITTYDALSLNRPIVTLPGEFRRGRFTLGCYRKMGITECVARDPDDYAAIAVALATDPDRRASVEEKIRQASPVLFEDAEVVREYERLFRELIEESRS